MATIAIHNQEGKKIEDLEVKDAVFGAKANDELLHQVFMVIAGNQRNPIAHTKDKSEVAGSGKKPFKQKGTGSARQGQKRNPVMKGGGVAFGPTNERNFKRDLNKKMKQKAVVIAISEKLRSGTLIAIDSLAVAKAKTKEFDQILKNLKLTGKVLVSFSEEEKKTSVISRNLKNISNIETKDLNVMDLLNNKFLLLSKASIAFLEEKFAK
ncbi:MAG: 50S ribosomal protein L4 [Candidatus Moranbacteria bacterium GW2011_GWC2_37_73]|nr:MAG: 50S ribosomal protein L4 [Parcubacteria group bacterium GW2011_GWC1_36_108]KKQ00486.1 MAG: 50S ribosomal protein L4 [Candidatus Moranbacteria bacterium GW2011_GWD1_36_198]KKQ01718.1 MAG: 50S ribosomal protein L4 [Candidatus Moranbacteria bacterium GW2011_GWD2_36_198]KKQ39598.1 MAG: 50S ribosomal protein L4 [Candidatus Moranbacteria bacterium GW2011_GWC2_37_73]HAR99971.1 50S ribosomal protein L4 [Candidatus Moranbacteria bacterium]